MCNNKPPIGGFFFTSRMCLTAFKIIRSALTSLLPLSDGCPYLDCDHHALADGEQ